MLELLIVNNCVRPVFPINWIDVTFEFTPEPVEPFERTSEFRLKSHHEKIERRIQRARLRSYRYRRHVQ